jgi:hypothetical protein
MTTLVLGASGATGKTLVNQLLTMGNHMKVIVRPTANVPESWIREDRISIIKANISTMSVEEMAGHLKDCQAVASCLGHNLTWRGIYGKPRKLVTDGVRLACDAIRRNSRSTPVKFVLMNTAGNRNRDLNEPLSFGERCVIALMRLLLPPHPDNEHAADYLRVKVGKSNSPIEWVIIRPDTLIDEDNVSAYVLSASPTRSAIFNAGKTSRVNVGNFMAKLIVDDELWEKWKGKMPVIYNVESEEKERVST